MRWYRELLGRYLEGETLEIVAGHGSVVADLALNICCGLNLPEADCRFVEEAAWLHDIGVCQIHAPKLGLYGQHPYIMHGVIGREILEHEHLPLHALVCERHIGVGLTIADIVNQDLPLPHRDMVPVTLSEQIICFADLFFSKSPGKIKLQKSPEQVRKKLASFGDGKVQIFDRWLGQFGAGLEK
jgi:uncharacterized protein